MIGESKSAQINQQFNSKRKWRKNQWLEQKLEENGVEIEFTGSLPGVKAEMAFLIKRYRETLENKYGKEKAENIYEETFDLSNCSEEEIRENFNREFVRELRKIFGAKND